ncbi:MAG: response regulator, partial [Gammaproteobacteria bacterium]|nr:response regulator [Gammaproteobacteria bacterium]
FAVEDSGIGITPEVIKRLFTPFVQADNSISRRYGGTGLGLHISQSLAKTMEGHIEVTSVVGKGSRFLLKLPYRESELLPQLPSNSGRDIASSVLQENFEGEVLIVEDTPELQRLERRILESVGATVTVVNNGEEAISMAGQQNFDLILMDMQMPIMGGLEATAQLRQQGNQTPIVALTANVMQKHKDQFNQVGANGFLQKPINKNELLRTLKIYLTPSQSPPTPNTSPDTAPTPLYGQPPYPLLVIDDDENILKLYQTVFEGEEEKELLMSDLEEIIGETAPYPLEKEFTLSLANQGKVGVEIAHHALQRGRPFPVAFIDMRMPPGMDGLETAKALRKLDERIYIVIVTAYTDHDPREIDRQLGGGVLYLQKPFSQQEIQQIARMFVDKWIKEHNPEEVAIENSVVKAVVKTQESGKESENMGAAPDFSEEEVDDELMAIFRESSRKNREKLTAALADKEWSEVRSVAHSIKGSATSFGYPGLSRMAESVQFAIDDERVDELPVLVMELLTDMGKMLSGTSNNALS